MVEPGERYRCCPPPSNPVLLISEIPWCAVVIDTIHQARVDLFYEATIYRLGPGLPNLIESFLQCHDIVFGDANIGRHAFIAPRCFIGEQIAHIRMRALNLTTADCFTATRCSSDEVWIGEPV